MGAITGLIMPMTNGQEAIYIDNFPIFEGIQAAVEDGVTELKVNLQNVRDGIGALGRNIDGMKGETVAALEDIAGKLQSALDANEMTENLLKSINTSAAGLIGEISSISGMTGTLAQITEDYGEILEKISSSSAELTQPITEFNETAALMNETLWTVNDNLVTIGGQINTLYVVIIVAVVVAAAWKVLGGILFRG
jgi:methyl-accepting chemotaxis protein